MLTLVTSDQFRTNFPYKLLDGELSHSSAKKLAAAISELNRGDEGDFVIDLHDLQRETGLGYNTAFTQWSSLNSALDKVARKQRFLGRNDREFVFFLGVDSLQDGGGNPRTLRCFRDERGAPNPIRYDKRSLLPEDSWPKKIGGGIDAPGTTPDDVHSRADILIDYYKSGATYTCSVFNATLTADLVADLLERIDWGETGIPRFVICRAARRNLAELCRIGLLPMAVQNSLEENCALIRELLTNYCNETGHPLDSVLEFRYWKSWPNRNCWIYDGKEKRGADGRFALDKSHKLTYVSPMAVLDSEKKFSEIKQYIEKNTICEEEAVALEGAEGEGEVDQVIVAGLQVGPVFLSDYRRLGDLITDATRLGPRKIYVAVGEAEHIQSDLRRVERKSNVEKIVIKLMKKEVYEFLEQSGLLDTGFLRNLRNNLANIQRIYPGKLWFEFWPKLAAVHGVLIGDDFLFGPFAVSSNGTFTHNDSAHYRGKVDGIVASPSVRNLAGQVWECYEDATKERDLINYESDRFPEFFRVPTQQSTGGDAGGPGRS